MYETSACAFKRHQIVSQSGGGRENILLGFFLSLYLSVNKYGKYPFKHPRMIKNFDSIENYVGITKIKFYPQKSVLSRVASENKR